MPIQKDNQLHPTPLIINPTFQEREESNDLDFRSEDTQTPLPLTATSRVLYILGDITAGPSSRFTQWLVLARKRSIHRAQSIPMSVREAPDGLKNSMISEQVTETSLWERLGKAAMLDIESSSFSWRMLSSLHHTEHSTSAEQSDDDPNKALEVTVNSGGVVFFALFNLPGPDDVCSKEASAVIKISSSRMATQSERLGYEIAKWLGIETPQARIIHNCNPEWIEIKETAEKAREAAVSEGDECGQVTCSELLEALELSRCIYLMSYVHGSPLLESSSAFESRTAEQTAAALGRILMLDLIIRNEDRLPCRHLRWRGNAANLLLAEKLAFANVDALEEAMDSAIKQFRPRVIRALQKDQRCSSADSRLTPPKLVSQRSDLSDILESPRSSATSVRSEISDEFPLSDIHIVAIDSGVPRRPPAGKRSNDQTIYPKLVELLLNNSEYASNLLHDITGGKLGFPEDCKSAREAQPYEMASVRRFRSGFRAALRDLQGFHMFLITLHQKLDLLVREFLNIINKTSTIGETEKDDAIVNGSPSLAAGGLSSPRTPCKDQISNDSNHDDSDSELPRTVSRSSSSANKDMSDYSSPMSRESWHGKSQKGSEPVNSLRLTMKLRDFNKYAKFDAESHKELERWNEMLRNDVIKLCQENNFCSGFFEGHDSNGVVDAYELKVRLEHILERISLINEAASTERPSSVTNIVLIGGALAARSVYTLQYLGITHILCLCSDETGQADSQYHNLFEYKNYSISDNENTNISEIFGEACAFIDNVEKSGGKVLVHCFEGKSRSATVVIAYLMLCKNMTLLKAWTTLRHVHRRAQPNDGFARILVDLDKRIHGKVSMQWQQRKPQMKVCPICGKNVGLSSSSLKLHLQKSHKLSSGSVDSATKMEIQKALSALNISRGGSASPTERRSSTVIELD